MRQPEYNIAHVLWFHISIAAIGHILINDSLFYIIQISFLVVEEIQINIIYQCLACVPFFCTLSF